MMNLFPYSLTPKRSSAIFLQKNELSMPYIVTITNTENNSNWVTHPTQEEFQKIKGSLRGRKVISIPCSLLFLVRSNTFLNFAKDFFLPTVINQALRVQSIAWKILALSGAVLIDALTFPVRLITCIPRILYNANMKEHPLKEYLISKGANKNVLQSDHVFVETSQFFFSHGSTITDNSGNMIQTRKKVNFRVEAQVNFIEMPRYPRCNHYFEG